MSTAMAAGTLVAATALGHMTADLLTDSCQAIDQAVHNDQDEMAACPPVGSTGEATP